jgi:hypothetical protein
VPPSQCSPGAPGTRTPSISIGMEPDACSAARKLSRVSGRCTVGRSARSRNGVASPQAWNTQRVSRQPRARRLARLAAAPGASAAASTPRRALAGRPARLGREHVQAHVRVGRASSAPDAPNSRSSARPSTALTSAGGGPQRRVVLLVDVGAVAARERGRRVALGEAREPPAADARARSRAAAGRAGPAAARRTRTGRARQGRATWRRRTRRAPRPRPPPAARGRGAGRGVGSGAQSQRGGERRHHCAAGPCTAKYKLALGP